MKSKFKTLIMLALLPVSAVIISSCSSAPEDPPAPEAPSAPEAPPSPEAASSVTYEEGVPGGIVVDTLEISARVTAINSETREVTLLGSEGNEYDVTVGPAAINFDQIEVGDLVNATLTEALVIAMGDESSAQHDGEAMVVLGAAAGEQPAGQAVDVVQVTGTVNAIDAVNRTATIEFDDGKSEVFPVRDDIDLSQHQPGEQVVFQVIDMIAISVEKP